MGRRHFLRFGLSRDTVCVDVLKWYSGSSVNFIRIYQDLTPDQRNTKLPEFHENVIPQTGVSPKSEAPKRKGVFLWRNDHNMMETCMHHSIYVAFKIIESKMRIHHIILYIICDSCMYVCIYIYMYMCIYICMHYAYINLKIFPSCICKCIYIYKPSIMYAHYCMHKHM